mgnify:CR=1 FL=1
MIRNFLCACFLLLVSVASAQNDTQPKNDTTIYQFVEQRAEYAAGNEAMYTDLMKSLAYPVSCKDSTCSENMFVIQFIVEKDGSLSHIQLTKGFTCCKQMNDQVLRFFRKSPKWKPAMHKGVAVRSKMSMPVNVDM